MAWLVNHSLDLMMLISYLILSFFGLLYWIKYILKGYSLVEYENFEEAQRAINELDGTDLLNQTIHVDWAFSKGPLRRHTRRRYFVIKYEVFFIAMLCKLLFHSICENLKLFWGLCLYIFYSIKRWFDSHFGWMYYLK